MWLILKKLNIANIDITLNNVLLYNVKKMLSLYEQRLC